MKKMHGVIVITVVAVIVGAVIALQLVMAEGANPGGLISITRLQEYEDELKAVQAQKEERQKTLNDLEAQISQIEQQGADADYKLKGIMAEQEKYKLAAGAVDVEGAGLEITVTEPDRSVEFEEDPAVDDVGLNQTADCLLGIVNKLKEAGAEAVSINDQRILSRSEIIPVEGHLNINAVPAAQPYIIRAIGDSDRLESVISVKYGIADAMRSAEFGYKVEVKKKDKVTIPRYSGSLRFRYAKPVEEKPAEGAASAGE